MVQRQGLIKDLNLVEDKLPEYLRAIEEGYNNTNPYHNRYGFAFFRVDCLIETS